ncbi:Maf family protein [Bacteriovoracaceae bacterium]|nr:Maf family protein [Bacteriovoracaceae bacterium]
MEKFRLILGSASPRRVELLSLLKLPFKQKLSKYDESLNISLDPKLKCLELADEKAKDILSSLSEEQRENSFLLTSDTVVFNKNKIFEKPNDKKDAFIILRELENSIHTVYTGVKFTFQKEGNIQSKAFVEETQVEFGTLPERLLQEYVNSDEPYDKAGAYGIQGTARVFVKKVNGCFSNVMGLPIYRVKEELENIFDEKDLLNYFH